MKTVLSLLVLATVSLAADYPVQDPNKCTPGTKFVDQASSSFLCECRKFGRQISSTIIGCLDKEKNLVDFGKTFDQIINEDQHGFRYNCLKKTDGSFEIKPISCVFAKGTKEETVTTGKAILKDYNQVCTCQDKNTRFSCDMLNA